MNVPAIADIDIDSGYTRYSMVVISIEIGIG